MEVILSFYDFIEADCKYDRKVWKMFRSLKISRINPILI